jgi:tetratricopeptide (TPR) repeat protein
MGLDIPKPDSPHIELFDSVQLLLRNAKRVNPRFVLEPDDKPFFVELCQLLQGSPLAIELASHWLRVFSLQEVVIEIRRNLDFLLVDQPDLPLRHRSMRAVFNASWQLLTPEQQVVLAKMSLLPSGFTLESLGTIAKATPSMLFALVGKSLVSRNNNRFVIHEVIRQFAASQLEPSQKDTAMLELGLLSHKWAQAFATQSPEKNDSSGQFALEYENVNVALEWAAQNKPQMAAKIVSSATGFWFNAAKKPVAIQWANRLLELPELQARDAVRANLLSARSFIGYRITNPEERFADAQEALDIALEVADLAAQATALHAFGEASGDLGNTETAISSIQKALKILEDVPNAKLELACLNQLAYAYWLNEKTDLAQVAYENLIKQSLLYNDKRGLANGYFNSSYIYIALNDLDKARQLLEQAIPLFRDLKSTVNLCYALLVLCDVLVRQGNLLGATELLHELGIICPQVQEVSSNICFFWLSAAVQQQQQHHAKALRLNFIAKTWLSTPGLDPSFAQGESNPFIEAQSSGLFTPEQLQRFESDAKNLTLQEAMQYALGKLEILDNDKRWVDGSVLAATLG